MKIALIGYGKMGKEIENIALKRNHKISFKIDNEKNWKLSKEKLKNTDVAIDFSTPQSVISNIKKCFNANIPVVVGTTGWYEHLEEIKRLCNKTKQTLFFSSNFSIGMNIFFELNKKLASVMSNYNDYDVTIEEIHHIQKLDAPSGTAIILANEIIRNINTKEKWVNNKAQSENELEISSIRENKVTGTHKVKYDSDVDSIEIIHTAKSRKGFALGAVLAAEFINRKKGFFEMKDMLKI
jgi:4-hydroxy-tetrahydrodipicolinate reductase